MFSGVDAERKAWGHPCQHHHIEAMHPLPWATMAKFEVIEVGPSRWRWTIYPKKSLRAAKVTRDVVWKVMKAAIAAHDEQVVVGN